MNTTSALILLPLTMLGVPAAAGEIPVWQDHPVNTWVLQSPRSDAPAPRLSYEGSGAWDPHGRQWIHFGGHDGIPQGFHLLAWDPETGRWEQRFPDTSPPGVCCVDGSNTFDVSAGRFVSFPGASLGHGSQWSRGVRLKQSHAWLYDPERNSWWNMRPPPYRAPEKYSREVIGGICSGAAYDPVRQVSFAFGGTGAGGPTRALFAYDAHDNRFEQLPGARPPPARDGMGFTCMSRHRCLVVFGSQYLDDERTWLYDLGRGEWEAHVLEPHPPALKRGTYSTIPRMAYDPVGDVALCVVWLGEKEGHETWSFDRNEMQWTKLEPGVEPAPSRSRSRNLSFAVEDGLFLLNLTAVDGGPQLWTFRHPASRLPAEGDRPPPPPRNARIETGSGRVVLTWEPGSPREGLRYRIRRAQEGTPGQERFRVVGTTRERRFVDEGLSRGGAFLYRIRAVGPGGLESTRGPLLRTRPRVALRPRVSVLAADRIRIDWDVHPAEDVVGYNVYRGVVTVRTVKRGTPAAWKDNDPEYPEPVVVGVSDITGIRKLHDEPLEETRYLDLSVDLRQKGPQSGDYRWAVYAYIVRAVNRLGTESGPSPYALTIPSEPREVLLREEDGTAEIRWNPAPEEGVRGYHVYKLGKSHWEILKVTEEPVREPRFRHEAGPGTTRYWIVAVDRLGQQGAPSTPVWYRHSRYRDFHAGEWHQ